LVPSVSVLPYPLLGRLGHLKKIQNNTTRSFSPFSLLYVRATAEVEAHATAAQPRFRGWHRLLSPVSSGTPSLYSVEVQAELRPHRRGLDLRRHQLIFPIEAEPESEVVQIHAA
jgi:hypothetical protein